MRIGLGFDVHKFAAGRKLILGGVEIPFPQGLVGHSDADVICHAIIDAIFGSIASGDIGSHFPDTDSKYKGISSLSLLKEAATFLAAADYGINNIDVVVMLEEPKLASFRETMRKNIANASEIDIGCVSIKATTTERLGFAGRGEGVAAQAVVLIKPLLKGKLD